MGRRIKTGKDRLDRYYHLAKEQGYRARSAFKLIQLAQKFNIFKNCQVLVDLCAAPGGWLQVAKRNMGISSKIIGVDLVSIKSIPDVTTIKCDITTERCRKLILNELNGLAVDVVLHDGAPNVGTSWDKDAYMQNELVLHSAELACEILRPNGIFVTKVFRSVDYNSILWVLNQLFKTVKATKPQSSRNVSAEIFLVCMGYKAPKKIDFKFFDPKYVFHSDENKSLNLINMDDINDKEDEEDSKQINLCVKKKMKSNLSELLKGIGRRNRDGYEEGDDYRIISVYDFFNSENPALMLLKSNTINLNLKKIDEKSILERRVLETVLESPRTTEEIKILCEDLKVLGKKELMQLLKWRFILLKEIKDKDKNKNNIYSLNENEKDILNIEDKKEKKKEREENDNNEEEEEKEEEDEDINQELINILQEQRKKNKSIEKKKKLNQKKQEWRNSLSKGGFDVEIIEPDLFKYTKEVAQVLDNEERIVSIENYFPNNNETVDNYLLGNDHLIIKDKEHKDNYENESENELDHRDKLAVDLDIQDYLKKNNENNIEYDKYKSKLLGIKKENRRKKMISEWVDEMNKFSDKIEEENESILAKKVLKQDLSSEEEEEEENRRNEKQDNRKKQIFENNIISYKDDIENDLKTKRWFSNEAFNDIIEDTENSDNIIKELSDSEIPKIPLNEKKIKKLKNKNKTNKKIDEKNDDNDIEFVPAINNNDDIIESLNFIDKDEQNQENYEDIDDIDNCNDENYKNPKNEEEIKVIQGIGSLLINKTTRMDLIDGSYNRYAFHDPEEDLENDILGLPSWFIDDENKHNKPELPITKELMSQYRAKLREIKNRPIRKETEALSRKKRRYDRLMDQARKKAQSIANSNEMNEVSKSKAINNLIKKAQKVVSKKRVNIYTVTRRHGIGKQIKNKEKNITSTNFKTKFVDRRLKKDKRALKKINKKRYKR